MPRHHFSWLPLLVAVVGCGTPEARGPRPEARSPKRADPAELARKYIIVDGHIDVPYRLEAGRAPDGALAEDVSTATAVGDFDHPRAVAGGLDVPFMSIYVPTSFQDAGGAKAFADKLIDMVEGIVERAPDKFALAPSVAAVRANAAAGKVSLAMGIENGAALEDDLANVAHFHRRGVRYITLTHSDNNLIGDSSFATERKHHGLSAYGRKVVAEMNRVGIMVDVSHVSDETFRDVMAVTKVPVIASHSSARHFTPKFERNMSDDMIRALAQNGGVILINFGSGFIDEKARQLGEKRFGAARKFVADNKLEPKDPRVKAFIDKWDAEHPDKVFATVDQVADHVMHVIELVGVDHVGFGSDFDGVGDSLPTGLKDVSAYPNLLGVLQERGVSDSDLAKICGENLLRVWAAVEAYAGQHR